MVSPFLDKAAATSPREKPPAAAEILARGWGYATVGYADIQPDRADTFNEGVIGTTLASGQTKPGPGDWGRSAQGLGD